MGKLCQPKLTEVSRLRHMLQCLSSRSINSLYLHQPKLNHVDNVARKLPRKLNVGIVINDSGVE